MDRQEKMEKEKIEMIAQQKKENEKREKERIEADKKHE